MSEGRHRGSYLAVIAPELNAAPGVGRLVSRTTQVTESKEMDRLQPVT